MDSVRLTARGQEWYEEAERQSSQLFGVELETVIPAGCGGWSAISRERKKTFSKSRASDRFVRPPIGLDASLPFPMVETRQLKRSKIFLAQAALVVEYGNVNTLVN